MEQTPRSLIIPEAQAGERLDKVLAQLFPEYSRSCLQNWLKHGYITLNGAYCPAKFRIQGGETLSLEIPDEEPPADILAEDIPLQVIFEDSGLIIINKPAGMVVHPAAGNPSGTLQNALLYHYPELAAVPRAGIVHRLDKLTSGLLVIARNLQAHKSLVDQLQDRSVGRSYYAIAQGVFVAGGTINEPVGRHPVDRKRMAVSRNGREAITHYRVAEKFRHYTALHIKLETGRTHQIRVHMAHIKKPLVGDPEYGGRLRLPAACSDALKTQLQSFRRQALHAAKLELLHPQTAEPLHWEAEMPADMRQLLDVLREDSNEAVE